MNTVFKIFLSMSFSGALLIMAMFLGRHFLKNKISRQWQYYIWIIVLLRLLIPFEPNINFMGKYYRAVDQAIVESALFSEQQFYLSQTENSSDSAVFFDPSSKETKNDPAKTSASNPAVQKFIVLFINNIQFFWLIIVVAILIRKITIYQSFIRYINAGSIPVSDIKILDQFFDAAKKMGIKKPIELCVNPIVSSPMLIGFFHPCIVMPSIDICEKDFQYIILHELTHYKRKDLFYKWLVQITVCVHWFNPAVHFMSREITKACEFSCDEAVLEKIGSSNAKDYGITLLDAMAAVGTYKESFGAVALSKNKQLLKERLGAIVNFKKKSRVIRVLTGVLTLCIIFGASFVGVYAADAADSFSKKLPKTDISTLEYVDVDFSGISITGKGPVGVSLVRTNESKVRFEYFNMDHPENCSVNTNIIDDTMQITIKNIAPNGLSVSFGEEPENIICIYIPNAIYKTFDIVLDQIILHTQDFHAPVYVTSNEAGFSLIDQEISRGVYNIDISSGPLYIEADTILKDITANVANGPIDLYFHKEPENLYLDTADCGPGYVNRPEGWPEVYRVGNKTPRLILSNYGPVTIEVKTDSSLPSDKKNMDSVSEKTGVSSYNKDLDYKWSDDKNCDFDLNDENWDDDWDDEDWDFDWDDDWEDEDWDFDWDDDWEDEDWDFDWDDDEEDYTAYGIICNDKSYYYQGKLVNVFLDHKPDSSFYKLGVNPKGTISIKINRNRDGEITGVSYMTEKEVKELLDDKFW